MRAITWIIADGDPVIATSRITTLSASLVVIAAGILGYTALRDLFVTIGLFNPWLGLLFPLLFDLAELAAAVSVLNAKLQGEEDRFAWRMVLLFTTLGILANIAHALHSWLDHRIDDSQAILAVIFTSLFPLSVCLVTHLLKRTITRQIDRQRLITTLANLDEQLAEKRQALATLRQQIETAIAEYRQQQGKLNELKTTLADLQKQKRQMNRQESPDVSMATTDQARRILTAWYAEGRRGRQINGSELGRLLGVSERTGRLLKNQLLPEIEAQAEVNGVHGSSGHHNGTGVAS